MSGTIFGVAHDPGGARAILPVLMYLHEQKVPVLAAVSGPAVEIASNEFAPLARIQMADSSSLGICIRELECRACPVLLSAAGLYNQIEHTMRLAARELGIPSVAVLDWWGLYKERFQRIMPPDGFTEKSHPDRICAIDDLSREGLVEMGFPPERIVVTGAVNLESSSRRLKRYLAERDGIRAGLGVGEGGQCAVFFSEPYIRDSDGLPWGGIGGYYNDDGTPVFGYTSLEMLREVAGALMKQSHGATDLVLCVKPHPMEHLPSLEEVIQDCSRSGLSIRLVRDTDPAKLMASGDVFFGMASIVLMEASLTAKPVFSVQIGLDANKHADPCVSNRLGFTTPVYDRASLEACLEGWRQGKAARASAANSDAWDGAASRVAESVLSIVTTMKQSLE